MTCKIKTISKPVVKLQMPTSDRLQSNCGVDCSSPSLDSIEHQLIRQSHNRSCTKYLVLFGIFVALVLINCTLTVMLNKYFSQGPSYQRCVPCSSLVLSYDDEADDYRQYFHQTGFNGKDPQCCATNSTEFQLLCEVVSIIVIFQIY